MEKCVTCNKKLMIPFKCRCEKQYCIKHRMPESHSCSFNYKESFLKELTDKNPKIEAPKIDII